MRLYYRLFHYQIFCRHIWNPHTFPPSSLYVAYNSFSPLPFVLITRYPVDLCIKCSLLDELLVGNLALFYSFWCFDRSNNSVTHNSLKATMVALLSFWVNVQGFPEGSHVLLLCSYNICQRAHPVHRLEPEHIEKTIRWNENLNTCVAENAVTVTDHMVTTDSWLWLYTF